MKSRFVKFVGTMGLVMFPCFAQADVRPDRLHRIDKSGLNPYTLRIDRIDEVGLTPNTLDEIEEFEVINIINYKFVKIKNGVAQAEADWCDFFSQHDQFLKIEYDILLDEDADVAKQVWVFVDANCHQQDVKDAVPKP